MDVEFLPPQRFTELDFPMLGAGGDGQIFTQGSGQPFDVITDLPTTSSGGHQTTLARSGAVHFANPPQNNGQRSYPDVDKYFAFQVNSTDASLWGYVASAASPIHSGQNALFNFKAIAKTTEARLEVFSGDGPYPNFYSVLVKDQESSFWGYASDNLTNYKVKADSTQVKYELWHEDGDYFATLIKSNESSFWGYSSSGYNYKLKADSSQVKHELWNDGGDYFAALVKSNESSFWGNSSSGYNYKTIADSAKASIEAWGGGKYIIIATDDFTANATTVKLRELDLCDNKKALFLCSEPYTP